MFTSNGWIKWKKFIKIIKITKINKFLEIEFDIDHVLLEYVLLILSSYFLFNRYKL